MQFHKDSKNRTYKTYGIVLRSYSMRESDRLVTVLTEDLGKVKIAVRGARKIKSRLGGHLQILNHALLLVSSSRTLDVVSGAEAKESFGFIKQNLPLLARSLYLMELTDAIIPEAVPQPSSYYCLLAALRLMNNQNEPNLITAYYELKVLQDNGYMPELYRCMKCGIEIVQGRHSFSASQGGVVCDDCESFSLNTRSLSVEGLKILRFFSRVSIDRALELRLSGYQHSEVKNLLGELIICVLEKKLNAPNFIEHLTKIRPNQ